MIVMTEFRSR